MLQRRQSEMRQGVDFGLGVVVDAEEEDVAVVVEQEEVAAAVNCLANTVTMRRKRSLIGFLSLADTNNAKM